MASQILDNFGDLTCKKATVQNQMVFQTSDTNSCMFEAQTQTGNGFKVIIPDLSENITLGSGGSLAPGSINNSNLFQANVVDNNALANDAVQNANISAGANIAKSKLAALEIADSDVAAGANIAKSKLDSLDIANADVAAGANIAASKLEPFAGVTEGNATASKAVLLDSSKDCSGINDLACDGSVQAAELLVGGASSWRVRENGGNIEFQKWNGVDTWVTKSSISGA